MSELKCPFCNSELVREGSNNYWCKKCNLERYSPALYGSQKLWQALRITVDKLRGIKAYYDDNYADPHTFVNWHSVAQRLANDADDAIKNITKGDDNE